MPKDDSINFGVPARVRPGRGYRLNLISDRQAPASVRACRYHPSRSRKIAGKLARLHYLIPGSPTVAQDAEWASPPTDRMSAIGYLCHYCGRPAEAIDHVWPQVRGGDDHPNNLVRSCRTCNAIKGSKSLLAARCDGCGTRRDPGDVDTATGRAFYSCRCGQSWTLDWDLQRVRL